MALMFSDADMALPPRWFTGEEWANGTAERSCVKEYKQRRREMQEAFIKISKNIKKHGKQAQLERRHDGSI